MSTGDTNSFLISMVSGVASGLLTISFGYLTIKRKAKEEFDRNAELEIRSLRIPIVQKLWAVMSPIAFRSGSVSASARTISNLSEELTTWHYEVGGVYLSKTSWAAYLSLQESLDKLINHYGGNTSLSDLKHKDFHYLQHEGSVLRSCTAKDCGTRAESTSDYATDIVKNIEMKKKECKECNKAGDDTAL